MALDCKKMSRISLIVELLTFLFIGLSCGNGWVMGQIFLDGVETDVHLGYWELCFKLKIGDPNRYRCWFITKFPEVNTARLLGGRIMMMASAAVSWVLICCTFLHAFGTIKNWLSVQLIAKSILCGMVLCGCSLVQAEFERDMYEDAWLGWACAAGWSAFVTSFAAAVITGVNLGSISPKERAD